MMRAWPGISISVAAGLALVLTGATPRSSTGNESSPNAPAYTQDGKLKFPANYREWVYVTSGIDMSYSPQMRINSSTFDNVFVNPEAYKAFLETGMWPDKTVLVLEARAAANKGSINKAGHFQTGQVMAREVHLKDEARFPGKWAFFDSEDGVTGTLLPKEMDCYSCHEQHAAVDTTFVQFYPTLLETAKKKKTLSAAYLKEQGGKAAESKDGSKKY
jgi:Cytochrome P460